MAKCGTFTTDNTIIATVDSLKISLDVKSIE